MPPPAEDCRGVVQHQQLLIRLGEEGCLTDPDSRGDELRAPKGEVHRVALPQGVLLSHLGPLARHLRAALRADPRRGGDHELLLGEINGRGLIRSVSHTYQRPSIIRLTKMVRRPRPNVKLTKREILRRDDFTCQYCGQHNAVLTIDHVMPRHMGGEHTWENLVTACPSCNHHKGGRTIEQTHMRLLRRPAAPPSTARYIFARHLKENTEWLPFIDGW